MRELNCAASDSTQYSSPVSELVIYLPGSKALFVRNPEIVKSQRELNCWRGGEEFYEGAERYLEQAEEDSNLPPEMRRVLALNSNRDFAVQTNRFGENERTLWMFQDKAEDYGSFLGEYSINEMPVYLINSDPKKPFARQMSLRDLRNKSGLAGWVAKVKHTKRLGRFGCLPICRKQALVNSKILEE